MHPAKTALHCCDVDRRVECAYVVIEQVLGDNLRLIHFPAMSIDEFTKIVVPAGLLDVDEENVVFRALLGASAADHIADAARPGGTSSFYFGAEASSGVVAWAQGMIALP